MTLRRIAGVLASFAGAVLLGYGVVNLARILIGS